MKFLTLTILALVALTRGEGVQDKRGLSSNQAYAAPAAASIAYTKLQQPVPKTLVSAVPQQYYAQAAPVKYAAAPASYAVPVQQQQYDPQAVAYAQPAITKYAAAPAPALAKVAYRPQFSLANDVSSFAYSSPVVSYNNLGLLTQVIGKASAAPVQTKVAAAPAPPVYQAQLQKFAYAQPASVAYATPAPVQTKIAVPAPVHTKLVTSDPQQYLAQVPQQYTQPAYITAGQAQGYSAALASQAQAYNGAQQTYTAQSIPQAVYSQAPQFFTQQFKQYNPAAATYAQ